MNRRNNPWQGISVGMYGQNRLDDIVQGRDVYLSQPYVQHVVGSRDEEVLWVKVTIECGNGVV